MNVVIQLFLYDLERSRHQYEVMRKQLRIQEFGTVFHMNLQNPKIKSIHVLCETEAAADHFRAVALSANREKAVFTVMGHQPTYKELVDYVKDTFKEKELVCIMNGDIYFNSVSDIERIETYLQPHHLFSLTRHEITNDGHTYHTLETCPFTGNGGSSDTFIFYTPLPDTLDTSKMNFCQNLIGAEAVFMKPWVDAGYEIWNPCDDIITLHLHQDRIHFESYATIDTAENAAYNPKTTLPSLPLCTDT